MHRRDSPAHLSLRYLFLAAYIRHLALMIVTGGGGREEGGGGGGEIPNE